MRKTENTLALLGGAVLGAAAMYLLDPEAGRRRRQTLAEAAEDTLRATGEAVGPAWSTLSERARGIGSHLADRASSIGSSLGEQADDARRRARDAGSGAYESSRDALGGWGESLGDWGRSFGRRFSRSSSRASSDLAERARRLNPWHEEESHATAYTVAGISAAALGAGLIYMLDPTNGRSRRKAAADQVTKIVNETGRAFRQAGKYAQDVMNRGKGTAYEASRRFNLTGGREPVSAEQLLQRVRSEMGHVVSHAGAIQVMTDADGVVTLSGSVLASEVDPLLTTVNKVSGVCQVINRLDVQDTVEGITGQPVTSAPRL